MRKSSLGRRSSTNIPTRIPSFGASGQRKCSAEKKPASLLRQPGFSQAKRSLSADRESYGGRSLASSAVRTSTASTLSGRNLGAMTPVTPLQTLHANLPTGSTRPMRGQTMSTDSNRRMSSFGGAKTRKDSRPLSEKSYQQIAQAKVQQYLDNHAPQFIGPGVSIRPMNTKLFVDLMDYLLKYFDSRIVITKSNYLEELPILLKKFGYRSKIDRSWLMTVNTPHSWSHVVGVLSWLVDVIECVDAVDEFDMIYTNYLGEPDVDEDDEDEFDMKIDKSLILHLKRTFKCQSEANCDQMDDELIDNMIVDRGCTDQDLEILQREIDLIKGELENEEQIRDQEMEKLEKLKVKRNAALSDFQSVQGFLEESKAFIQNAEEKLVLLNQENASKRLVLTKKQEELQNLKEKVGCQQISLEDKDKLLKEKHNLLRTMQFNENAIQEYEKSAFTVDLKLAENQRKLEKLILEYNKLVAEKVIAEPRLKDVEVKFTPLIALDKDSMDVVNCNLKNLKDEYKNSFRTLEAQREEAESVLWRVKQDIKETMEEIAKETTLLEGVECDLEKQEELITKESQKLKEEANRYQKITKEIIEEMAQFDQAKLEDKKIELKKLEHDWELLQKRIKQIVDGELAIKQEVIASLKTSLDNRNKKFIEFQKKHLQD